MFICVLLDNYHAEIIVIDTYFEACLVHSFKTPGQVVVNQSVVWQSYFNAKLFKLIFVIDPNHKSVIKPCYEKISQVVKKGVAW